MMDYGDLAPLWHREANDLYFGAACEDEYPLDEPEDDAVRETVTA